MKQREASVFINSYAGFLFDMDGTLVNSIPVVERIWGEWAVRHGRDVPELLKAIHGVRVADYIRSIDMPHLDATAEASAFLDEEMRDVEGIRAIAGAVEFLNNLPSDRWAIVTSAPRELALVRLKAAGIAVPAVMVAGQDVVNGKPDPSGYKLGAKMLGLDATDCLVFEDAPAGIQAGQAAGSDVVVITETHTHHISGGTVDIRDYTTVGVMQDESGRLRLHSR